MSEAIAIYNSMAEFYTAMGGTLEQEVDFTIHRLEDVHGDIPVKSPLFRANYYSIIIIVTGRGKYFIDRFLMQSLQRGEPPQRAASPFLSY